MVGPVGHNVAHLSEFAEFGAARPLGFVAEDAVADPLRFVDHGGKLGVAGIVAGAQTGVGQGIGQGVGTGPGAEGLQSQVAVPALIEPFQQHPGKDAVAGLVVGLIDDDDLVVFGRFQQRRDGGHGPELLPEAGETGRIHSHWRNPFLHDPSGRNRLAAEAQVVAPLVGFDTGFAGVQGGDPVEVGRLPKIILHRDRVEGRGQALLGAKQ